MVPVLAAISYGLFSGVAATLVRADEAEWPFEIKSVHRPGTYFWSPGSAWDKANVDYNLERYHEAGIGTLHIVPIYGARGYEDKYIQYLSPKWWEMFDYLVRKAHSLGMNVDMTTGTGWCFGGPGLDTKTANIVAQYDPKTGKLTFSAGRMVKRPAPGGEGYMLNPYSPSAMTFYLERFSKAFEQPRPAMPRAQYHDSFEYVGNFSPELPEAFKARHGYDLAAYYQTLFGDKGNEETRARLKYDYRVVLSELHYEFIKTWVDWTRSHGMVTRDQAHGSPSNLIDTYAACDIPETEMFGAPEYPIPGFRCDPNMARKGDSDPRVCMLAASAAHIAHEAGKQLVSSESCTWLREHWHTALSHVKLELDQFFLTGVNHVFYHGSCYSPKEAPWPGWFFYASTKFDWRNSFWRDFPILNEYVARCQSVLQAGEPDNDILLYWPIHDYWMQPGGLALNLTVHANEWMSRQRIGHVADLLLKKGYAFDIISDRLLRNLAFRDGRLCAVGGRYRAIVVPACRYVPVETLRGLADLAEKGAMVIFENEIPKDVPGMAGLNERRKPLTTERERLEKANAVIASDLCLALEQRELRRETMADAGLKSIRRKVGEDHYYFIANQTAAAWDGWLAPARPFVSAVLLDPMTGHRGMLAVRKRQGQSQVYLQIAPGESCIVRLSPKPAAAPKWTYLQPKGEPISVAGPWQVDFVQGEPNLPASYKLETLASWTDAPDEEAKRFTGTGRYRTTITLPTGGQADDWLLDLGDVRESARVRINGQDAGALIALPYRLRVGRYLKTGENALEIEVTNLSANRVRDLDRRGTDWKIMKDINIVTVQYREIKPAKWPLEPSGLLGPVRLAPMARVEPSRDDP
jgi:hypothetical protein